MIRMIAFISFSLQYASQFCIYFSTLIAEVNNYFFEVIQKVSELHESFTTGVTQTKMSANVCIHVEKIGKQPDVCINRHSTKSLVSLSYSKRIHLFAGALLANQTVFWSTMLFCKPCSILYLEHKSHKWCTNFWSLCSIWSIYHKTGAPILLGYEG